MTYPGRGRRIKESLLLTMEALVEDSWRQIEASLYRPYVLFGHSLGATLAYLLAHKVRQECRPAPLHLILSGTDGPSVAPDFPPRYLFSKADFKDKLKSYGGIADELLNDEAAFDFFEPILRADFQIVETWTYTEKPKLDIPASVITGTEEDMTEAEIRSWQKEFNTQVDFKKMDGRHFFLFENPKAFVDLVQQQILRSSAKAAKIVREGI